MLGDTENRQKRICDVVVDTNNLLNLWNFFYLITYNDKILYPGTDYGLPECKFLDWASFVKCMYHGTGIGMGLE